MKPCGRCGAAAGEECLCGNADFEIGGIFAAHSLARHAIITSDPEADRYCTHVLERIDEARTQIDRRTLEQKTAWRGRGGRGSA